MVENKVSGSGFMEGYLNEFIKNNSSTLNMYAEGIKNQCVKLGIEPPKYEKLPKINSRDDLEKWVGFGNYLKTQVRFKYVDKNRDLKELAYNYICIAELVKHKPFSETAKDLADIITGDKN